MKHNFDTTKTSKLIAFVFCLLSITPILAQSKIDLKSSYDNYVNLPREVAFGHLNKSLYIQGETIGFSVYVFDKNTKKPSTQTTNVYAVISDKDNNTIKEQMLWAKEGKANGLFNVDSLFTTGNYTFKAYTNWMRNFDEQNYFVQNIKIVDPSELDVATEEITSKLDAQFLPEGGHIVANAENNIGVVIKDVKGFGIQNISGRILDQNENIVTQFKTNDMGIGKFTFRHEANKRYKVDIDFRNRIQTFDLNFSQSKGVNLMLNELRSKVMLTFNTNAQTLPIISGKPYTLMIHNGYKSSTNNFQFNNALNVSLAIEKKNLEPGLNIFTVFNEKNQPILERLYFNFDGLQTVTTNSTYFRKESDSLAVQIPLNALAENETANVSVSVMPAETKSYNTHHNILSYTMLQPYVKGYIENARYYFTDITAKKKFDLDNLLLTQGWSSYNWSNIFNNPPQQLYDFEQGIAFKATSTKHKGDGKFILHTSKNHEAQAYVLKDGESTFADKGFIIEDEDMLEFTEVISESKMKKANLSVQLRPIKVPSIRPKLDLFNYREQTRFEANSSDIVFDQSWEKVEQLDEVVVQANIQKKRFDELSRKFGGGRVDLFDDDKRNNTVDLATYLNGQGYQTSQNFGRFSVVRWRFGEPVAPLIYWNGQRVLNFDIFFNFDMKDIDYIAIDLTNKQYDAAQPSAAGSIHIKTDPNLKFKNDKRLKFNQKIGLPLTFTSEKQYYAPKYVYYNTDFFRDYGVIDWIPEAEIDDTNMINLKFLDTNTKQIKVFIEGTTNTGKLISEAIEISVDDI
ncbi:hypothetical protein [Psychroserpens sp.]|uniref:hypothetical protein n=1 Tax=Psychroserpens sp. TaxID=2020870 RepID=UPI001B0CB96D|nr:hypothetical protein [Psychroserpens sp.]MBO6605514.1 hypothetical protein [Psychroserpens sp.]MBO6630204.1 hypothetical protein [Psychroserpens sp.]MBO6653677.1 hypothetical protein [Psychroserpens sp.]MBO6681998.1 hypothetical protein [Psychroserpens sp.]MBO6748888.1 hypothetical protein [Psychroserpens sp.]